MAVRSWSEQPESQCAASRFPTAGVGFLDEAAQHGLSRVGIHEQDHAVGARVDELAEVGIEQSPVRCPMNEPRQNLRAL